MLRINNKFIQRDTGRDFRNKKNLRSQAQKEGLTYKYTSSICTLENKVARTENVFFKKCDFKNI